MGSGRGLVAAHGGALGGCVPLTHQEDCERAGSLPQDREVLTDQQPQMNIPFLWAVTSGQGEFEWQP